MKNLFLFILTLVYTNEIAAQTPFPDTQANTYQYGAAISEVPIGEEFTPTAASLAKSLPSYVFNDLKPYFPNIIDQSEANSCVQVAEIGYVFTYEINGKRGLTAGDGSFGHTENLYSQNYTYNFLNKANPLQFTTYGSGFRIAKRNGIPSYDNFNDEALSNEYWYKYWMTGFEKYYTGMHNTIKSSINKEFYFNSTIPGGLDNLKHWIADHSTGEVDGGIAVIGIIPNGWLFMTVPSGQYAGQSYIWKLGQCLPNTECGHALTIVGYDDNIPTYGAEHGAFKVANSKGKLWENNGFIWLPYYLMYPSNPGLQFDYAYSCDAYSDPNETIPEPSLVIKTIIQHNDRNKIQLLAGSGDYANSTIPDNFQHFYCFNFQGGNEKMRGCYDGPLELGLNFGHYFQNTGKVFFQVKQNNFGTSGTINSFSLVDHRWGEDFELQCNYKNVPIKYDTTNLSIEYNLLKHESPISENLDLYSNRVSRFKPVVSGDRSSLIVHDNVRIDMYNSDLTINSGCSLVLMDNAQIIAKRGNNKIIIDGSLILGSNVKFVTENEALLEIHLNGNIFILGSEVKFLGNGGGYIDLYLNNESGTVTMQGAKFERTNIISKIASLILDNCNVENEGGYLFSKSGNVNCTNSTFTNTGLYLSNSFGNLDERASVMGCTFTNTIAGMNGISIQNYGKYSILNNSIVGYSDGINLYYSGTGVAGNQKIENNVIHSCQMNGIIAYNSAGTVYNNNIYNNYFGVRFMNICNFALNGNPEAQNLSQTQQIRDNTACEVYASEYGFPWYFRYNSIVDNDNLGKPTDPLIYFDRPIYANFTKADVKYNQWGVGFDPAVDFMGNNTIFLSFPEWAPGSPISTVTPDQDIYTNAVSNFEAGNYSVAKNLYQLLIELYPKSDYAQAAMKELLRLEEYAGNDYSGLKAYLKTNDSIISDTTLTKLADISANQCDVRMGNWPDAINWYENRIINPETPADSIFAVIDLGYVYQLMEADSLKSQFVGRMPEYKPVSKVSYIKNKDYLLSLLPINTHSTGKPESYFAKSGGFLYQNIPNPSNGHTTISYTLEHEAETWLVLSDLSGKEIKRMDLGVKPSGTHTIEWQLAPIASGLYVYSLILNGVISDVKKMSVIE